MKSKIYITTIILSTIVISSCQEDNIIETGTVSSQDYLFAENIFNDVGRIVEDAFIDNGVSKSCPSYTILNSDTSDSDTIILDFGDGIPDDCLSYNKERRGKIIITYSGKYRDSLSIITTTFDQYYVNNNGVNGVRVMTNNGRNTNGNINFTIEVREARITGNGTINWESTRNREWITGYNTFNNHTDDSYLISGTANGNSSNGQEFEITITKDLYVDLSCLTENSCIITSGEIELTPTGFSKRIINYGDSICDCNYTVTLNGTDYFVVSN